MIAFELVISFESKYIINYHTQYSKNEKTLPIIDIFAGPGGLGEGFSRAGFFDVVLSIEKDYIACNTLKLRKFYHEFSEKPPSLYYDVIKGYACIDELKHSTYNEWKTAEDKSYKLKSISTNETLIHKRISKSFKK